MIFYNKFLDHSASQTLSKRETGVTYCNRPAQAGFLILTRIPRSVEVVCCLLNNANEVSLLPCIWNKKKKKKNYFCMKSLFISIITVTIIIGACLLSPIIGTSNHPVSQHLKQFCKDAHNHFNKFTWSYPFLMHITWFTWHILHCNHKSFKLNIIMLNPTSLMYKMW